jgi:hypothetical protein
MQLVGPKMCMFSHFVRVGKVFTAFFIHIQISNLKF